MFLRASLETLVGRLRVYDDRPLLKAEAGGIAQRLSELLKEREPVYEHVADFIVDVDGKSADENAREEKRRKMLLKLERTLSPDKIDACVREWLGDRKRMLASELPLSEDDTFIKLIYIRLYGQRKRMGYRLEMKDTVEREGFRFRDFEMIWKERQRDE